MRVRSWSTRPITGSVRNPADGSRGPAPTDRHLLKIEVQGASRFESALPDAILIFVVPPSVDELVRRQVKRNTESTQDMTARR